MAVQAQQFELERQGSVAVASERAEQAKDRALAEERERAAAERKRAVAQERDRQQQEKYRALAEERERAKVALARVEAADEERIRQERQRAALEVAALQQRGTCARCSQEYVLQDNEVGACKCCYNPSSVAQVHVEGMLWHAGAELTNWVKMRRRWSCCPQNEVYGTFADLQRIGCKAHVPVS
uniref:Uncharacterized protein n=1 Tax=Hemiselmis tepida TaxID=464990 RepID=A0A7S0VJ21_9CRYP|mmetsp:Transcript_19866/g.50319  ORF Transcript_19866/g.50319 Transcript_19866/m.50319 type:complete len:183 (+) Transcript_19866:2-550(+)